MTLTPISVQVRNPIHNNRLCDIATPHCDACKVYNGHLLCKDSTYPIHASPFALSLPIFAYLLTNRGQEKER